MKGRGRARDLNRREGKVRKQRIIRMHSIFPWNRPSSFHNVWKKKNDNAEGTELSNKYKSDEVEMLGGRTSGNKDV
jgi:hypothetical protein